MGHESPMQPDGPDSVTDPFTKRLVALGKEVDRDMAAASIDKCNCMIRCGTEQLPAIRKGKEFFTPEGHRILTPNSFEDMPPRISKMLMDESASVYIGHMFAPWNQVTESGGKEQTNSHDPNG